MTTRALILVDIQNDFLPGGALAVPGGNEIVPLAAELMDDFKIVVATQDWHPPDHGSFAANHPGKAVYETIDFHGLSQTLWPVHCMQGTPGADFASDLDIARITRVFQKGTRPEVDSYSGFHDNGHRHSTGMAEWLKWLPLDFTEALGFATGAVCGCLVKPAAGPVRQSPVSAVQTAATGPWRTTAWAPGRACRQPPGGDSDSVHVC